MDILKAESRDLPEILQLQKLCYLSEAVLYNDYQIPPLLQSLDALRAEYDRGTVLKAVIGEELVGSVRGYLDNGVCYIGKLMVKPNHENKGIGRKLMTCIEEIFAECHNYEIFTGHKSRKNLVLYQKLGYEVFDTKPIHEHLTLVYMTKTKV